MNYNPDTMMQLVGHHVDAIFDPNHPLANHPFTAQLGNAARMSQLGTPDEIRGAVAPHIQAMNDPYHPLGGHDFTMGLRNVADYLNSANPSLGVAGSSPASNSPSGIMPMNPPQSFSPPQFMSGDTNSAAPSVPAATPGNSPAAAGASGGVRQSMFRALTSLGKGGM